MVPILTKRRKDWRPGEGGSWASAKSRDARRLLTIAAFPAANRPGPPRFAHRPCTIDFSNQVNWISWGVVADEVIYSQPVYHRCRVYDKGVKAVESLQQSSMADHAQPHPTDPGPPQPPTDRQFRPRFPAGLRETATCRFSTFSAAIRRLRIALHTSGSLMEWLDARHGEYVDRLAQLAGEGRIEILGGPFYEPILAMIPAGTASAKSAATAAGCKTAWARPSAACGFPSGSGNRRWPATWPTPASNTPFLTIFTSRWPA